MNHKKPIKTAAESGVPILVKRLGACGEHRKGEIFNLYRYQYTNKTHNKSQEERIGFVSIQ